MALTVSQKKLNSLSDPGRVLDTGNTEGEKQTLPSKPSGDDGVASI
jgi:hypothetical protein